MSAASRMEWAQGAWSPVTGWDRTAAGGGHRDALALAHCNDERKGRLGGLEALAGALEVREGSG